MSNYLNHAMLEFKAAGWLNDDSSFKDEMQELICKHVLELLDVFKGEGHSGSSAPYAINLFSKLASFEPISPLTGEDWEWTDVCDYFTGGVSAMQNKRCSAVFKQSDRFNGQAYYLNARVFWSWVDDDGKPFKSYFTNADSAQPIEFPYTPVTEYVEVKNDEQ